MMQRDLRVDVLRFVALVSMFVAHCAPASPIQKVTQLSEFLTAALFAMLVGMGSALAWSRRRSVASFVTASAIRGAVLIGIAAYIDDWGAHIVIVLAFLGVLTWVCALTVALPSVVLATAAAALALSAPWLQDHFRADWIRQAMTGHHTRAWMYELTVTGPYYRVAAMLVWAFAGMLLVRYFVLRSDRQRWLMPLALGAGLAMAAMFVLNQAGLFALEPYDGRTASLIFNGVLAALASAVVLRWSPSLPGALERVLATTGAMTLTMYVLQIAWLAYYVRVLHPGKSDDTWLNVVGMSLGAMVLAAVWHAVVRWQPWRRGPLEGPVDFVVRAVQRVLP
ncbi:hypothetical protein [Yimella sp. cx-51]|uniref:hypothetical protein n=1 Tax=Yimella sp. cx-51 TaxID=2770551 RepID=UPI00165E0FD0|nr:hypothetical protein [Yimella sp. cx-51]MBC9956855.1 hypothetical protein [Yimella sp. cx-51]QTH39081.1 hypothetical protein J5M86_05510 [Yimella sp. cx-51]